MKPFKSFKYSEPEVSGLKKINTQKIMYHPNAYKASGNKTENEQKRISNSYSLRNIAHPCKEAT